MASTSKDKVPAVPEDDDLPDLWTAAVSSYLLREVLSNLLCCVTHTASVRCSPPGQYIRVSCVCRAIITRRYDGRRQLSALSLVLMPCKTVPRSHAAAVAACQAHVPIPDDAWEYQIRKSLNDAAYQGLEYVPYCTTMPVKANSEDVAFMWVRARD